MKSLVLGCHGNSLGGSVVRGADKCIIITQRFITSYLRVVAGCVHAI